MSSTAKVIDKEIVSKILEENDTFLFDCDGVLWSAGEIFPGVSDTLMKLKQRKKKVIFVTNNSTKSRQQYLERIRGYGIETELNEVYSTAYTCALYLKQKLSPEDEVYVLGNPSIGTELDKFGIKHFGIGPDDCIRNAASVRKLTEPMNKKVKAVLVGFDDYFNYTKLTKAISYLAVPGTLFVATNMDANFPAKGTEYRLPGTGAFIQSVIFSAERNPDVIGGKPDSFMIDCIKAENDFDESRAIMVGDRLDTDILFGNKNGLQTLLVMTGVTTQQKLDEISHSQDPAVRKLLPNYYSESLAELGKYL